MCCWLGLGWVDVFRFGGTLYWLLWKSWNFRRFGYTIRTQHKQRKGDSNNWGGVIKILIAEGKMLNRMIQPGIRQSSSDPVVHCLPWSSTFCLFLNSFAGYPTENLKSAHTSISIYLLGLSQPRCIVIYVKFKPGLFDYPHKRRLMTLSSFRRLCTFFVNTGKKSPDASWSSWGGSTYCNWSIF